MPAAAVKMEPEYAGSTERPRTGPAAEDGPYQPRFRVVTRKPLPRESPRPVADSLPRALLLAALPAACLLVYVVFGTLNMRGAYYRDQLNREIRQTRIEQAELEAEKRRRQSPGLTFQQAAKLGMQPAAAREFAQVSAPKPGR